MNEADDRAAEAAHAAPHHVVDTVDDDVHVERPAGRAHAGHEDSWDGWKSIRDLG